MSIRASLPNADSLLSVAVLEDDALLREDILIPGLREFGFRVSGAGTAGELYRLMLQQAFDLVVLDLGLPDESGLSVVTYLRSLFAGLGIVVLTGNRGRSEHARALYGGADAFLRKPTDPEILALTLRNLAQRLRTAHISVTTPSQAWRLQSDGWCLLAPDGTVMVLTSLERCLMRCLDAQRGQAIERETLVSALEAATGDFDLHRLEMLIHRLRRKAARIASDRTPALPLLSSRGMGYLLAD
ncbi:PhoP family transcriptional regulator [Xanthomonas oryzae]|uniref:PhoP family transcriptional regulator n=1 Tax=Xanthomonas oryzae TaxID=347 RepID=A0AAP0ZML5_9XANT|nr:response regulator transcription factor [Xanthomonas oryzae]KOR46594.1 PhoP family transcriptional regulator [Xanthomonas oryzae]QBG85166.1 response regulator transcription factor [Xanthomonas oryzae]